MPGVARLRGYGVAGLRADAVAGVTLAAYLIPAAMGDATLAGLPVEAGLYACFFSGLVFWLLCSSSRTAVTVTSAISLLVGTTLGGIAGGDTARFGALASCTALLVAGLAVAAWAVRAGSLVRFVSESVLIGFKTGVALTLAVTQLPKLFGTSGAHGSVIENTRHFFSHLNETNGASLAVGLGALAVLVAGKLLLKNQPVAIFVVAAGIVVSGTAGLAGHGVKMLGDIPRGLPRVGVPAVRPEDLNDLLPLAVACFLLGAVETAAIGRMFASRFRERFSANQEFLGIAAANLAAGLGRGLPVSGGMSQSLVNESAGARSPLSGLVASGVILLVAAWFTGLLRDLPQPVLAAIVLMAVAGLVNVKAIVELWRTDRQELLIAAAALAGVVTSGLLRGVLIGAMISLVLLIRRASRPHVAFLGRIPGTRRYSDMDRHPDNERAPGVIVFRPEASLVYFNADHVKECVLARVAGSREPVRLVVGDLSGSPLMDMTGAEMLKELHEALNASGVRLRLVEARSSVRDRLRLQHMEEDEGRIDRYTTVADAVEAFETESGSGKNG